MPEAPSPVLAFAETTVETLLAAVTSKLGYVERSLDELERDVRRKVSALIAQNEGLVQDPPSRQWLIRTSIVLAVHQVLKPLAGGADLISILSDAMTEPFR